MYVCIYIYKVYFFVQKEYLPIEVKMKKYAWRQNRKPTFFLPLSTPLPTP